MFHIVWYAVPTPGHLGASLAFISPMRNAYLPIWNSDPNLMPCVNWAEWLLSLCTSLWREGNSPSATTLCGPETHRMCYLWNTAQMRNNSCFEGEKIKAKTKLETPQGTRKMQGRFSRLPQVLLVLTGVNILPHKRPRSRQAKQGTSQAPARHQPGGASHLWSFQSLRVTASQALHRQGKTAASPQNGNSARKHRRSLSLQFLFSNSNV